MVSTSVEMLPLFDPSWETLLNDTLPERLKAREACSMQLKEFSVSPREARFVQFVAESVYGLFGALQYIGFESINEDAIMRRARQITMEL